MMMDTVASDSSTSAALEPSATGSNAKSIPEPKKMDKGGVVVSQRAPPPQPNYQKPPPPSEGVTTNRGTPTPLMEVQPAAPHLTRAQKRAIQSQDSGVNGTRQIGTSLPSAGQSAPHVLSKAQNKAAKAAAEARQGSTGGPAGVVPSGPPPLTKGQRKALKAAEEANQVACGAAHPHKPGNSNTTPNSTTFQPNGSKTGFNNALPRQAGSGPSGANFPGKGENKKKNKKGNGGSTANATSASVDPKMAQVVSNLSEMNMDTTSGKSEVILMVSGLPGKMDFRILKEHLQEYASQVSGRVKYVYNGQAFITFVKKTDAERAIKLFHGREVYGKKLNIQLSKSIPFQNPPPPKANPTSGDKPPSDFVMVDSQQAQPSPMKMAMQQALNRPAVSSSSANLFVEQIGAFATAAMIDALKKQGTAKNSAVGQKGKTDDPNCVIQ